MTIEYPDVSSYQTGLSVKGAPLLVARASVGDHKDTEFKPFKTKAAAARIPFVGYHFLWSSQSVPIETQAALAFSQCGKSVPLMVDVEPDGADPQANVADAVAFVQAYRAKGGIINTVYLPRWFWEKYRLGSLKPLADLGLSLVSSDYGTGRGFDAYGGMKPAIWQFTGDGQAASASDRRTFNGNGKIDFNRYPGSLDQLKAVFGFPTGPVSKRAPATAPSSTTDGARPAATFPPKMKRLPEVTVNALGERMIALLERYYPKVAAIEVTSGTDGLADGLHGVGPNSSYHYGKLKYNGSPAAALDLAGLKPGQAVAMRDVAKWLYDNFAAQTVEEIHTTPFDDDDGFYVRNQQKYPGGGPYAGDTAAAHGNHVHWATSEEFVGAMEKRLAKNNPNRAPKAGTSATKAISTAGTKAATSYTVKSGDTLSAIAAKYNTTVAAIMKLNAAIRDPDVIKVDQKIRVK